MIEMMFVYAVIERFSPASDFGSLGLEATPSALPPFIIISWRIYVLQAHFALPSGGE